MEDAAGVMMEYDQQPGLIASDVAKTLESFQNLEGLLSKAAGSNDVPEGANLNDFLLQMGNDLTRFKMWVGNQAAHQSGPSSLDYRLREAAHLKQQVIYLLKDIFESLQSAKSLAQDGAPFLEQSQEDGTDKIVQDDDSYFSPDPGEDDKSDCSDSDSNTLPRLSLSTILIDIAEAVDCLLRLSVAIANPAPHDRSRKLGTKPAESLSFYEPYEPKDIAHVRNEFPSIANELAVALGMFITRRRQFFECRQAHHERFTSDEETDTYYTGLIQEDTLSENEMSQTMSAHHWFVPNTGQAKVPMRPIATEDGIFKCPFCYRMICAKTNIAWGRHVFGDLRPYKCIDPSCIKSNSDFERRRDWKSHVSKYHWRSWSCPFKCQQLFSSAAELSLHIREYHFPAGTEEELKSITALGEKDAPDNTSSPCPLCGYTVMSLARYIDHVGCHLEQLALFALPRLEKGARDPDHYDWIQESHWSDWNREPGWGTKYIGGSNEQGSSEHRGDAGSAHSFSAIPPSVFEKNLGSSLEPPSKGKEAAFFDHSMSDVGSSDLLEPILGKKSVKRESWSEDVKGEHPVRTPNVPADVQDTKRKGKLRDEGTGLSMAWLPRESATKKESSKEPPMDYYSAYSIPDSLVNPTVNSKPTDLQSTDYPGYHVPNSLQSTWYEPSTGFSSYYMPQKHHPMVPAVAMGSLGEVLIPCVHPGCTVPPFKRRTDLERHIEDTHSIE